MKPARRRPRRLNHKNAPLIRNLRAPGLCAEWRGHKIPPCATCGRDERSGRNACPSSLAGASRASAQTTAFIGRAGARDYPAPGDGSSKRSTQPARQAGASSDRRTIGCPARSCRRGTRGSRRRRSGCSDRCERPRPPTGRPPRPADGTRSDSPQRQSRDSSFARKAGPSSQSPPRAGTANHFG
jgi:hypothetical protein